MFSSVLFRSAFLFAVTASSLSLAQTSTKRCPNLVVVFDTSGSMLAPAKTGAAPRYEVARDAVKRLVTNSTSGVRFGLEFFGFNLEPRPADNSDRTERCMVSSPSCFYSSASTNFSCASVEASPRASSDIVSALDRFVNPNFIFIDNDTPTANAIQTAATRRDVNDPDRATYLLLVTDGNPANCPVNADNLTPALQQIEQVRTNQNVKTFVLSFAGGTRDNLAKMAVAGGTARHAGCALTPDERCYYYADDAASLDQALNEITNQVGGEFAGCTESCYQLGCPSGQFCKNDACVADPCAAVTCNAGSVCSDGQCKATCSTACRATERCENGTCVPNSACSTPCTGTNQICVNGQCQEDYCSGSSFDLRSKCAAANLVCSRNACQAPLGGNTGGGGGDGTNGGNGGGATTPEGPKTGGCAGVPGAPALLTLALGLGWALRQRRRS